MRKNRVAAKQTEISILALDDDEIMTITLQSYFQSSGYHVDIENDPNKAVLNTLFCNHREFSRFLQHNLLLPGHFQQQTMVSDNDHTAR